MDNNDIVMMEMRVQSALYLLAEENLEPARRNRLIEFLERVANGEELISVEIESKSEDYDNDRDFDTEEGE